MNKILSGSLGTKLIFVLLFFIVLSTLTVASAADNQMDNVICGNELSKEEVSLEANDVETISVSDDDCDTVEDDSSIINSKESKVLRDSNSNEGKVLSASDLKDGSLTDLFDEINACTGNEYKLTRNYVIDVSVDDYAMPINKNNFIIDGQGHSINAKQFSNLLFINGTNITLKNINFIQGAAFPCYGFQNLIDSVYINGTGTVMNCTFVGTWDVSALAFEGTGLVENCSFINNSAVIKGGAIYLKNGGVVKHSRFINNSAPSGAGIYAAGDLVLEDSYFKSNFASDGTHVFFAENGANVTVKNVTPSYAFGKSFKELNNLVKSAQKIILTQDYVYMPNADHDRGAPLFLNGIEITRDNTVIDGQGHSISGEGLVRIFKITANNVVLKNINFFNGFSNGNGGAIALEGRKLNMIIENCNFTNNFAKGNGGAVFGNATISNSLFEGNTAEGDGGAFSCTIGKVMNCTFLNGMAKNGGGIDAGELTCSNSTFEANNAEGYGGGINAVRDTIEGCEFTNNSAKDGGAFYSDEIGTIKNSAFSFNNAKNNGGAACFNHFGPNEDLVDNCTFANNTAQNGGAIYTDSPIIKISNSEFSSNSANDGKSLYLKYGGDVINSNVDGNSTALNVENKVIKI